MCHLSLHFQGALNCLSGNITLYLLGIWEESCDGITTKFPDDTTIGFNQINHGAEILIQDVGQLFSARFPQLSQSFAERCETRDIRKERYGLKALFPVQGLPWWLMLLVRVNPLSYGVDLVRWLVLGFSYYQPWLDLGFLAVFGALTTGAAVFFFNRGEY